MLPLCRHRHTDLGGPGELRSNQARHLIEAVSEQGHAWEQPDEPVPRLGVPVGAPQLLALPGSVSAATQG